MINPVRVHTRMRWIRTRPGDSGVIRVNLDSSRVSPKEIRNQKPGIRNQKPGTRNQKPETGKREPESGNRESESWNAPWTHTCTPLNPLRTFMDTPRSQSKVNKKKMYSNWINLTVKIMEFKNQNRSKNLALSGNCLALPAPTTLYLDN